ncbi:MAG: TonB-dependent receptor, partial [Candidatus Eremiobacteraeota bacterium]|nr:TonB-dependent receptor [Candidatus Eremiobacteraeota bacterium]
MLKRLHRICRTLFIIAALVAPVVDARQASAQSESGRIDIAVTDQATKAPVTLARVLLDGPVIASELTSADGTVDFTDVPDGIYRARVAKGGYQIVTSAPFEVVNGRYVNVSVALALSTGLKVIGTVVAHSSAIVSSSTIGPDSAQRKLSNDLSDALNKLSGVSVSTSSDDSDATQTVSLEGHDAGQTALTLDGVPLNAPGTAGNLGAFATDLFGGASVRNGPQLGGLGGGVNFSTLQPTLSWLSNLSISAGTNGRDNYSFGESGSFGKLGVAAQTTYRENPSLVDGQTYVDASGIDYSHDGDSSISGKLAKLRYQFSDSQTLTATFLNSTRSTNLVCLRITSAVPCGYGPGNTSDGNVQMYSLSDNALVGETTLQGSVYSTAFNNELDELNRFVDGAASPIGYSTDSKTRGLTLNATLPSRERHTISLQSYATWSDQTTVPLVPEADPYYNSVAGSNYAALQISDSIRSNDKLNLTESFGANGASGGQSSLLGSIGAQWRPTAVDSFNASYAIGGVAASPGRSTILTDPASLRFDCNGNVAYGNAPGDAPAASSSVSARAGYTRSFRGGNVSFQAYRQVQNGTVLPVQVNGSALLAGGVLSPGYLAAVQQLYDSAAGCGAAAGTPFAPTQLYFSSPVAGVTRVYEGGSLSGYATFGNLIVQPYYNLNVSKALSNDPRIVNPYSITISGQQLPNVPLQKAGLVLDYKPPRSSLEWLADAQYTGKNNPNNLPAFTTFDAGVSANLISGTLTAAV